MSEPLQPYIPGFSPDELYKGKFAGPVVDFSRYPLRVQKHYGDYHIWLKEEAIREATTRINFGCPTIYQPLRAFVESDEPRVEVMFFSLTRDTSILYKNGRRRDIVLKRDEFGPLVWVYTPRVAQLLEENPTAQLTDRYDGHSDKIWIIRDIAELSELMLKKRDTNSLCTL